MILFGFFGDARLALVRPLRLRFFRPRASIALPVCLIVLLSLAGGLPASAQAATSSSAGGAAPGVAPYAGFLWAIVVMAATGLLGLSAKELAAFKASKWAQQHSAAERIADLLDDICSAGMAFFTANPTATPHAVAAWALSEIKASAPGLITQAGSLATDEALSYAVNRKLVTAAQAAPVSQASTAVIAALAPSASTARVTPPQMVAVAAAATAVAPAALEDVMNALLAKFPGLAALAPPTPSPAVSTVTAVPEPTAPAPVALAPA
jgi:hypothetical protein